MMAKKKKNPIPPYQAIGLSTVVYGVCERSQINKNLNNIEDAFRAAVEISNINMPVRIVALSEGALTGFTDEVFDIPHRVAAKEIFIESCCNIKSFGKQPQL